jgi:hypothetical protein
MGYFSNGTEGESYFDRYCSRCIHDRNGDCPIWGAHLAFAYGAKGDAESILNMLIPRSKDGLWNEQCVLWVERDTTGDLFAEGAL